MRSYKNISINEFINDFKTHINISKELEELFTTGYCYYFALILQHRYADGEIYYLSNSNHWIFKLFDKFYDITGEIDMNTIDNDELNNWKDYCWSYGVCEPENFMYLIQDCILKNKLLL